MNDAVQRASDALDAGDHSGALNLLRLASLDPSVAEDPPVFRWAMGILAVVVAHFASDEGAQKARDVMVAPDDIQLLYDLGYACVEYGIPDIAVIPLWRANFVAPGLRGVVVELCAALEDAGRNGEAVGLLSSAGFEDFLSRYLLAFNQIASGDLGSASEVITTLEAKEELHHVMRTRLRQMLQRASAVPTSLDSADLRGWHFVMTGGILLDLSPHGLEVMCGRYAYLNDSFEMIREGLSRLGEMLESWGAMPSRVAQLPGRGSAVVGLAAAELFGLPLERYSPATGSALLVGYDLGEVADEECLRALGHRREGQPLFVHAACWTSPPSVAADFSTLLYQVNVPPWGSQKRMSGSGEVERRESDDRTVAELARSVVDAHISDEDFARRSPCQEFGQAVSASLVLRPGCRQRLWSSSPVKSGRFH